jgi:hypothetical protein
MMLDEWARAWGVSGQALADLKARMGVFHDLPTPVAGDSEAAVQSRVRVAAARRGIALWRNNSGAGYDEAGNFMRWGLGNDSAKINKIIKSADLIGIRPIIVQPDDVGRLIGQFVSYEIKHAGWKWTGSEREQGQLNWAKRVTALGGDGRFLTSESQL